MNRLPDLRTEDFIRSYDLHDGVDSDIPTRMQPGEPGAHWLARGLLTETCLRLLGRPLSLGYYERSEAITLITVHVSLASTVLSTERADVVVAVELLLHWGTGRWRMLFAGRLLDTGRHVPSPALLAERVAAAYAAGREASPVCRGPVF